MDRIFAQLYVDEDFEILHRLYLTEYKHHWGIIVAVRRPPATVAALISRLLNRVTADELSNRLLYV